LQFGHLIISVDFLPKVRGQFSPDYSPRRNVCTNMYLVGIDAIAIMGFSGHRTIKSFMKYIGVKQEQNAMRLKDNPFFKK